jgi:hypothetical protein
VTDPHSIFDRELHNIPDNMRRFLVRGTPTAGYEKTWGYFANAYGRAFDELVETSLRDWPNRRSMDEAIFYLCRHSIELSIKSAILECAEPALPNISGHNLLDLWARLQNILANFGIDGADDWTKHCMKLVRHIGEADPDGERFRYPSNRKHVPFEFTRVELQGLAVAHWHICMLCEASVEMLDAKKDGKF